MTAETSRDEKMRVLFEGMKPSFERTLVDFNRLWYSGLGARVLKAAHTGSRGLHPAEVPLERLILTARIAALWEGRLPKELLAIGPALSLADATEAELQNLLLAIGCSLLKAPSFLWLDTVRITARDSTVPKFILEPAQFPFPIMWWTWETDLTTEDGVENGIGLLVTASALEEGPTAYTISYRRTESGEPQLILDGGGLGDWGGPPLDAALPVFRLLSFLNSPYLAKERHSMTRAQRREMRDMPPQEPVTVVTLRAPVQHPEERRGHQEETTTGGVEWQYRWLVRGHIRNQWYPAAREHHLIWIPPYTKGPEGLPMKETVYAVHR